MCSNSDERSVAFLEPYQSGFVDDYCLQSGFWNDILQSGFWNDIHHEGFVKFFCASRRWHAALPVAEDIAQQANPGASSLHEDGRAPASLLQDLAALLPLGTKGKFRVLWKDVVQRELYL